MPFFQGHFLIASSVLRDPNFSQSIVLMVQHDAQGAMGLVVNRPLDITVQQACEEVLEESVAVADALHQGGPCDGVMMVLHTSKDAGELEVIPGVFFTTQRDKIEWLMRNYQGSVKYFVGYSGWSAGQLEAEMESGSWLTVPAKNDLIFGDNPRGWAKLIADVTLGKWVNSDRIPDDPSVN